MFWYTSVYHNEKKSSPWKSIKLMKAWFFLHVYETMEALKGRAKSATWRPYNEGIIDMCLSSDDEDQIVSDEVPVFKIEEKPTEPNQSSTFKPEGTLRKERMTG